MRLVIKDIAGQYITNSKTLVNTLQVDPAQQLNCNATENKCLYLVILDKTKSWCSSLVTSSRIFLHIVTKELHNTILYR